PKAVGAALEADVEPLAGAGEELLHVLGHEAPLLASPVALADPGEVHVLGRLGDADVVLVAAVVLGIDALDLELALVYALGVQERLAQEGLEVHPLDLEHLADDVVDATAEVLAHLFELLQQPEQEAALDRVLGAEVEDPDLRLLADPVDAAHALLEPHRVPGQVVVDHQVAELEVDPLARRLGRHADLPVQVEVRWISRRLVGGWPPWIEQTS